MKIVKNKEHSTMIKMLKERGFDPKIITVDQNTIHLNESLAITWEMFITSYGFNEFLRIIKRYDEENEKR